MITPQNRRQIFALCNRLGYDDETRRTVQHSVTGKESLTQMSDRDAFRLIEVLKTEMRKKSTDRGIWKNRRPKGDNIINLMTPEQRDKIIAMSMQLYDEFKESKMDHFCKRQYGKPFRQLTTGDAIKLIEAQKLILKRKGARS